jgi:hypothetical protein
VKRRRTPEQRRAHHVARIEAATRPGDVVSAAADYLRAELADLPLDDAERIADAVAVDIVARLDMLEESRA